jgi:dTDP-glucose 4,6-dehydratase
VKDRPGDDRRYALDNTRIQGQLGWAPRVNFEEGIRRTIDWYEYNHEWLDHGRSGE